LVASRDLDPPRRYRQPASDMTKPKNINPNAPPKKKRKHKHPHGRLLAGSALMQNILRPHFSPSGLGGAAA
jgi:hypothetical protein